MYPASAWASHCSHSRSWGKPVLSLLCWPLCNFCFVSKQDLSSLLRALCWTAHAQVHGFFLLDCQHHLHSTRSGEYFAYSKRNSFLFCFKCRTTSHYLHKKTHFSVWLHWIMLWQSIHFTGGLRKMARTQVLLGNHKKKVQDHTWQSKQEPWWNNSLSIDRLKVFCVYFLDQITFKKWPTQAV